MSESQPLGTIYENNIHTLKMRRGIVNKSQVGSIKSFQSARRVTMTLHNLTKGQERGQGTSQRGGGKQEAPVSIEGEQRGVVVTAQQATMDVKNFRSAFKNDDLDFSGCHEMAVDVVESVGLKEDSSEVNTPAKFHHLLKEKKLDAVIQKRFHFQQLSVFCDKAMHFLEVSANVKQKLTTSIDNHLTKFLLSFASEADNHDIKCVKDYQAKINKHEASLKESRAKYNLLLSEISESMTPFIGKFLLEADDMNRKMDEALSLCLEMCDVMKRWSSDDRSYPSKLWDEIINSNMIRGRMLEELKRTQRKRDDISHTLARRTMAKDKVVNKLEETKAESKKSKSHKVIASEKVHKLEHEIVAKKKELEDTEHRFIHRKSNSPRFLEMLENRIESLKEQLVKINENLEVMSKQLSRHDKSDSSYSDTLVVLEKEVRNHDSALATLRHRLRTTDHALAQAASEVKEREARIAIAKKIREMKLTPTTIRKLYYQQVDPATKGENS